MHCPTNYIKYLKTTGKYYCSRKFVVDVFFPVLLVSILMIVGKLYIAHGNTVGPVQNTQLQ